MNRLWQHCAALAFGHRRASVVSSAWAVRPASLAAGARASVFQGFCDPALPGKVCAPLSALSRRASPVVVAPELIGRLVSRKVAAMRPSPEHKAESLHTLASRLRLAQLCLRQRQCSSSTSRRLRHPGPA